MPTSKKTKIEKRSEEMTYLAESFRRFGSAIAEISDFEAFRAALERAVEGDTRFRSQLMTSAKTERVIDAEQAFGMGEILLPLESVSSLLKIESRRDSRPFGVEDLQLMGAMAEFMTGLFSASKRLHLNGQTLRILQYLVNQLPLGVICFDAEGELIVKSKLAEGLLGEREISQLSKTIVDPTAFAKGKLKLHFEIGGRLVYCEGRRLEIDAALTVAAFVLYDFSKFKKQLEVDLDREAYRVESRGGQLSIAFLELRTEAGLLYRQLRDSAKSLGLAPAHLQPLDAHCCVCLFPDSSRSRVRGLLRELFGRQAAGLNLSLLSYDTSGAAGAGSPSEAILEEGRNSLEPAEKVLLPRALVFDSHIAVTHSLETAAGDLLSFRVANRLNTVFKAIHEGLCDALVLSLECLNPEQCEGLKKEIIKYESEVKVYYTSYRQSVMLPPAFHLEPGSAVFQKPFSVSKVRERLEQDFKAP